MSTMNRNRSASPSFLAMVVLAAAVSLTAMMLLGSGTGRNVTLPRSVPTIMSGLKPEHHDELNQVLGISPARYGELRREYENNPIAQQQIDVYDPATEYHERLREYVEALKLDDREKAAELEDWFEEHYPDIH